MEAERVQPAQAQTAAAGAEPVAKRSRSIKGTFTIRIDRHGVASTLPPPAPPRFVPEAQEAIFDPFAATDEFGWYPPYHGPQSKLCVTRGLELDRHGKLLCNEEVVRGLRNDIFFSALPEFLSQSSVAMLARTCRALYWVYAHLLHPTWFERTGVRDGAEHYSRTPIPMRALMDGDLELFEKLAGRPLDKGNVPYPWSVFFLSATAVVGYAAPLSIDQSGAEYEDLATYNVTTLQIDQYLIRVMTAAACYRGSDVTFFTRVVRWLTHCFTPVKGDHLRSAVRCYSDSITSNIDEWLGIFPSHGYETPADQARIARKTIDIGFALAHGADPMHLANQLREVASPSPAGVAFSPLSTLEATGYLALIPEISIVRSVRQQPPCIESELCTPLAQTYTSEGHLKHTLRMLFYDGWRPDVAVDRTRLLPGWRHAGGRAAEAFIEDLVRTSVPSFTQADYVQVPGNARAESVEHLWQGYVGLLAGPAGRATMLRGLPCDTIFGFNLAISIGHACRPLLDWMYKMLAEGHAAVDPNAFKQHYGEVLRRFWTSTATTHVYASPDVVRMFMSDLNRIMEDTRPSRDDALTFLVDLHDFYHKLVADQLDVLRTARMEMVLALARANMNYYDATSDRFVRVWVPYIDPVLPWSVRSVPDELHAAFRIFCGDVPKIDAIVVTNNSILARLTPLATFIAHAIDLTDTRRAQTVENADTDVDVLNEADLVRYQGVQDGDTDAECQSLPYFVRHLLSLLAGHSPPYANRCEHIVEMIAYLANGYARGAFAIPAINYYLDRLQIVTRDMRTNPKATVPIIEVIVKAIQRKAFPAASMLRLKNALQRWISAVAEAVASSWCKVENERGKNADVNRMTRAEAHGGRAPRNLAELGDWAEKRPLHMHAELPMTTVEGFQRVLRDMGAFAAALLTPVERFELLAWTAIQPSLYACGCELRETLGLDATVCLAAIAHGTLVTRRAHSPALRALPLAAEWDNDAAQAADTELALGCDTDAYPPRFTHGIFKHLVRTDVATVLAFTRTANVRAVTRNSSDAAMLSFFGALASMQTHDTAFGALAHFFEECCGEKRIGEFLRGYSVRWIFELASQMLAAVDRDFEILRKRDAEMAGKPPRRKQPADENAMDIDESDPSVDANSTDSSVPSKTKATLIADIRQHLRTTPRSNTALPTYDTLTRAMIRCADAGKNWVERVDWLLGHLRALSYPKFDVVSKVNKELKAPHPRVGPRAVAALPVEHRTDSAFEMLVLDIVQRVRHYIILDSGLEPDDDMEGVEEAHDADDEEEEPGVPVPSPPRGKRPRDTNAPAASESDNSASMEDGTEPMNGDNPFPLPMMSTPYDASNWNNL